MSSHSHFTLSSDISSESVSSLKSFLSSHGVNPDQFLEKSELISKCKQILQFNPCTCGQSQHSQSTDHTSSSSSSTRYFYRFLPVGYLSANCVLIGDRETSSALLIDPGGDENKILELIKEENVNVKLILHTHLHFDHCYSTKAIHQATQAPIAFHSADSTFYNAIGIQCMMIGVPPPKGADQMPKPELMLEDNMKLPLCDGLVFHTPGHSPGSICFYFPPLNLLCSGDTLFRQSIGRSDLMGGNSADLVKSIQNKLYSLPEDTIVIPGHGEQTSIGFEKKNNKMVKAKV
jgi:hydroxyacylglutathione hydrolase